MKLFRYWVNFKYAFNPRKPKMLLRLVWNYSQILFGVIRLRYVDIQIGNKCNMRCPHCFANRYEDSPKQINSSTLVVSDFIKEAMSQGAVNFSFQGGETLLYIDHPFVCSRLDSFIRAARPDLNIISVSTNGLLINRQMCEYLKGIGVDILTISVDSFRPVDPWDILSKALIARACGLKVTLATVVTRDNYLTDFMWDMIDFSEEYKMVLNFILAVPIGGFAGKEVLLNDEEVKVIKGICDLNPYARLDFDSCYCGAGCPAGTEVVYIRSDGSIQACPFLPRSFGDIQTTPLLDARRKMVDSDVLSKHRDICIAGEKHGQFLRRFIEEGKEGVRDGQDEPGSL